MALQIEKGVELGVEMELKLELELEHDSVGTGIIGSEPELAVTVFVVVVVRTVVVVEVRIRVVHRVVEAVNSMQAHVSTKDDSAEAIDIVQVLVTTEIPANTEELHNKARAIMSLSIILERVT